MTEQMEPDARVKELIDLIKLEYETARSFLDGVVRVSNGLRPVAVALVTALLGFALAKPSWPAALCGLAAVLVFGYLDAYHGWLYTVALSRVSALEGILALRYKQVERDGGDDDVELDVEDALAAHRFGQYQNVPTFKLKYLLRAQPHNLYVGLYGALAALAVAATVYAAVR